MPEVALVRRGKPVAMKGLFTFDEHSREKDIVRRYAAAGGIACAQPDAAAVPILIHKEDLKRVAPLWLKWTQMIRNDREAHDPSWQEWPGRLIFVDFKIFARAIISRFSFILRF